MFSNFVLALPPGIRSTTQLPKWMLDRMHSRYNKPLHGPHIPAPAHLATPLLPPPQRLVETAMLAAVTGLAYTVGNLLRLEGYLAYGLPLPIVLAALRSGPLPALKTLAVAVLLLLSERGGGREWRVVGECSRQRVVQALCS